jgi:hypothetical protein
MWWAVLWRCCGAAVALPDPNITTGVQTVPVFPISFVHLHYYHRYRYNLLLLLPYLAFSITTLDRNKSVLRPLYFHPSAPFDSPMAVLFKPQTII